MNYLVGTVFYTKEAMVRRIMVIDDEPAILEVVTIILESNHFEVCALQDPDDIIATVQRMQPEIILLDIKLGSHDGRKICADLKYNQQTHHLPIILFSASSMLKEDVVRWGADDFISKPFDIDNLLATVNAHVK